MFNSVQYVRDICKERGIAISQLEKDCGFSNGYLNPKKITRIAYDRAVIVAEYLGINVSDILDGPSNKKAPALTEKDERSGIAKKLNVLRIAGRDGSYEERLLTDEQLAALKAIIDQLPDASDDL